MTFPSGPPPHRRPGDGWVDGPDGTRHWGLFGAAGLLLSRPTPGGHGEAMEVVLQHRVPWSDHGGTWGIPGGARDPDETAAQAALRESAEEAGIDPAAVRPLAHWVLDLGHWSYTTVLAEAIAEVQPRATDVESLEVAWVPVAEVTARRLLPAFAEAWPLLREVLGRHLLLVVDAANVVGSRPDGWWRDRRGATSRLRDHLARLTVDGVPGTFAGTGDLPSRWWPRTVLVVEGEARGVPTVPGVEVVEAAGSGDDAVVAAVAGARASAPRDLVVAVTADRGLRARVEPIGAAVRGPGSLWELLDRSPEGG